MAAAPSPLLASEPSVRHRFNGAGRGGRSPVCTGRLNGPVLSPQTGNQHIYQPVGKPGKRSEDSRVRKSVCLGGRGRCRAGPSAVDRRVTLPCGVRGGWSAGIRGGSGVHPCLGAFSCPGDAPSVTPVPFARSCGSTKEATTPWRPRPPGQPRQPRQPWGQLQRGRQGERQSPRAPGAPWSQWPCDPRWRWC